MMTLWEPKLRVFYNPQFLLYSSVKNISTLLCPNATSPQYLLPNNSSPNEFERLQDAVSEFVLYERESGKMVLNKCLEDTQVGYNSNRKSLDPYTLELDNFL